MDIESTCPICLENFGEKTKASPDACDHVFCLPCLEKWSKLGSYCPVDRKRFKKIFNLNSDDVIQIKRRKRKKTRTVYDFTTLCEVCSNNEQPHVLLLCDCCDLGYHIYCLSPPLKEVPSGLWLCPTCISIEEKLKKRNGITKEVEADMGHVSNEVSSKGKKNKKRLDDAKKPKKETNKPKKLESIKKNDSILEVCRDTISEFEYINIDQKNDKDLSCSKILDSSFSKIDKISKSFNFISESGGGGGGEHSKQLKTYSVRNSLRNKAKQQRKESKPPDALRRSQRKTRTPYIPDMYLIQDDVTSDIDLCDYYSTENMYYGIGNSDSLHCNEVGLTEPRRQEVNEEDEQSECFSKINYLQSENLYESVVEGQTETKNEKYNSGVCEDSAVKNMAEEKLPATRKSLVSSYSNESGPVSNSDQSGKGTFNNLISEILNKNNNEKQKEEKARFSVFQKIESISSQNIYSQFIATVDTSFPSKLYTQHCCTCKDKIFVISQKHCRICKLKYFKNPVKSEKYSKCTKNSKNVDNKCLRNANNTYLGSGTLDNQKVTQKKNSSALERRKHSLIRTLKKIQDSK